MKIDKVTRGSFGVKPEPLSDYEVDPVSIKVVEKPAEGIHRRRVSIARSINLGQVCYRLRLEELRPVFFGLFTRWHSTTHYAPKRDVAERAGRVFLMTGHRPASEHLSALRGR